MPQPADPPPDEPLVIRGGRPRQPVPGYVWLLLAAIILFFVMGVLLVTSGLLGGSVDSLPGPTAFTLTP